MAKMKTAYELACERVIRPTYKMKLEDPDADDFEMPEFVEAWKSPHGPIEHQSLMIEDKLTESMIDQYDPLSGSTPETKKKEESKKEPIRVEVQEPMRINYDYDGVPCAHWYGHFTSYTGFSRMNRAFAFGLSNRGVKLRIDIQGSDVHVNEATEKQLLEMSRVHIPSDSVKIFGSTIPLNMSHSGKKVLYTMMETSCTLHPDYLGKLNLFEEIWVPTHFNKKLFKENGVHSPIHVMPLGVDVNRYTPDRKEFNFGKKLNDFVFLSVFKWGYRKGFDILLKSYLEEFSSKDNVTLVLVSKAEAFNDPDQIVKDFQAIRRSVDKEDQDLPHIILYDDEIAEKDMPKIYGSSDAFCLISRGEGFGLPYAEAGASGLPVIASNCSGHSDFLNDNNSYLVEPEGYERAEVNGNLPKLAKHCRFYEDQLFPKFGRASINKTKEHMRYVLENYDESLEKAERLRNDLVENFTWDKATSKVHKRILELNKC